MQLFFGSYLSDFERDRDRKGDRQTFFKEKEKNKPQKIKMTKIKYTDMVCKFDLSIDILKVHNMRI